MEELKLQVLTGTARSIAMNLESDNGEIELLIDGVMDYMLTTGTNYIETEHLDVSIDFSSASIERFIISDGLGRVEDLKKYTAKFLNKLNENQAKGLKRLSKELIDKKSSGFPKMLIFGKN